jgi:hypothetical protein
LRALIDSDASSVLDEARRLGVTPTPFSLRELVTPQFGGAVAHRDRTWSNWLGDFAGRRRELAPTDRTELVAAVVDAVSEGRRVRAVGSGHSHSAAPEPPEYYVNLKHLTGKLPHNGWLDPELDETYLVRVRAGTVLRRLNRDILYDSEDRPPRLALENMGSFDGQTLAGAVNTATHGTGLELGSLADSVRSVELVAVPESASGDPLVRAFRIEPSDGITDRAAFDADVGSHRTTLIQDDDLFHSVVVGYGCMGIVYAYTLAVRDSYWLEERSHLVDWNTLKGRLGRSAESVREFVTRDRTRHFQFLLNLAAEQVPPQKVADDDHGQGPNNPICLVRRHRLTPSRPKPDDWGGRFSLFDDRWPPERRQRPLRDLGKSVLNDLHPFKPNEERARQLHVNFFHPEADTPPFVRDRSETVWYVALRRLPDRGEDEPVPPTPATTTEIAVPLDQLVDAVDDVRRLVTEIKQYHGGTDWPDDYKDVFFGVPLGVRFVGASPHYLSPEYDRQTAMLEVPFPVEAVEARLRPEYEAIGQDALRDDVAEPALAVIERELVENRAGRPHMGKHNTMTRSDLDAAYEQFDAEEDDAAVGWLQAYERFNAFGTFDNAFTQQLGIGD